MGRECEVAVIGGGVIGASVAYYLSREGRRVTLFERGQLGCGASGANSGAVSTATKKPGLALGMAMSSARMFPSLAGELECDLEYQVNGTMILFETESEREYMLRLAEGQQQAGLPTEVLSGEEARRLEPALGSAVQGATYCAGDALLNPHRLTLGFARAARRLGATILADTPVEGIEVQGGRVLGVRTSQGRVGAAWVVNAAGPRVAAVGRMAGVDHAITPRRGQLLLTERRPGLLHARVGSASQLMAKHRSGGAGSSLGLGVALRPTPAGNLILGSTNELGVEDTSTTAEATLAISAYVSRIAPSLRGVRIVRSWSGLRPGTPEGLPVLGIVDGPRGYLVAGGHAGDGIALAPVTGRYLAQVIASEARGPALPDFLAALLAA